MTLSVYHGFVESAKQFPTRNALYAQGQYYSYDDLLRKVSGIRSELIREEFDGERLIGIWAVNDMASYAGVLAILSTGAGYVPFNPAFPVDRTQQMMRDADLRLILASRPDPRLDEAIRASEGQTVVIYLSEIAPTEPDYATPVLTNNSFAYLLFTSGSTGRPKGVPIYHRSLNSFMRILLDKAVYDFTPDDRFLQAFELTFDLSVVAFFAPLSIGACTYLLPLDGVKYLNIIQALEEHAITVILMVPSVLNYLQNNFDEIYLPKLRYSMFCGEALLHSMMEKWSKCIPNAQIDNLYGPTEATVFCFRYRWELERSAEESVNGIVPIGQPMPDIVAFITDENRKTVPEGEKGELCLYGNQLTYGYFNDPQKTHQSFFILPEVDTDVACYATGDECYINEKGDYIFCNRLDEQVKIDGYRVEVGEIEHFVRVFDPSAQAAVVAVANAAGALELHLFIVLDKLNTESLKNHLKDRLPAYMQPKMIHVLQQLPLNDNGKTDRKALKSLALQHS